jgi:hypothetical protein
MEGVCVSVAACVEVGETLGRGVRDRLKLGVRDRETVTLGDAGSVGECAWVTEAVLLELCEREAAWLTLGD